MPTKTLALPSSSKTVAIDDKRLREMAPEIEAQFDKARPALAEIVKLWAMVKLFQAEAVRLYSHAREFSPAQEGRKRPSKATDLKALFEKYLPNVELKTAYRLFSIGGFIAQKFEIEFLPETLQRKIEMPKLAVGTPRELEKIDRRLPGKQRELFKFADGDSQRSWLDQFSESKGRGGNQYDRDGDKGKRRTKAELLKEREILWRATWTSLAKHLPEHLAESSFQILEDEELDDAINSLSLAEGALRAWRDLPKNERNAAVRDAFIDAAKRT